MLKHPVDTIMYCIEMDLRKISTQSMFQNSQKAILLEGVTF